MFQQVSLVSPIANAVAIPLVSLVVVPLTLLAAVLPLDWLAQIAHAVMALCMSVLEMLDRVPDAAWQQHAPPPWTVPLALLGALWMLLPRGFPARWVGAGLHAAAFLWLPPHPPPGDLWLTVLDVGQGLAVVARTRGHALLYDTGPAFSEQVSAGERIVVPYLRASGIRRLDGVIISHDDLDHSGGALAVLQAVPVQWLSSPLSDVHPISEAATRRRRCSAGERWEWDGVVFEMLHPDAESYNDFGLKDNDRSCVLRIDSPYGAVLLPADIERRSEIEMLRSSPGRLSTDVLIAPHHGSRTSSTPEFVRAVAPRLVVFSVGYHNRFGHPHPAVVRAYREQGSERVRTDLAGAVLVKISSSDPRRRAGGSSNGVTGRVVEFGYRYMVKVREITRDTASAEWMEALTARLTQDERELVGRAPTSGRRSTTPAACTRPERAGSSTCAPPPAYSARCVWTRKLLRRHC